MSASFLITTTGRRFARPGEATLGPTRAPGPRPPLCPPPRLVGVTGDRPYALPICPGPSRLGLLTRCGADRGVRSSKDTRRLTGLFWRCATRDTRRLVLPGQMHKTGIGILSGEPIHDLRLVPAACAPPIERAGREW